MSSPVQCPPKSSYNQRAFCAGQVQTTDPPASNPQGLGLCDSQTGTQASVNARQALHQSNCLFCDGTFLSFPRPTLCTASPSPAWLPSCPLHNASYVTVLCGTGLPCPSKRSFYRAVLPPTPCSPHTWTLAQSKYFITPSTRQNCMPQK